MTALPHSDQHPVPALVHRLREELASLAGAPLWSMTAAEVADALLLLTQARSQLDELLMRMLRHAESVEVGTDLGATTAPGPSRSSAGACWKWSTPLLPTPTKRVASRTRRPTAAPRRS